jgi:D-glycerate 3-kinase
MNINIYKDIKKNITNSEKLFVAIHGPQGSGKSTLCEYLIDKLTIDGYRTCAMSLDDFYYDYDKMKQVLKGFNHELYKYRGLAGTHDLERLYNCLDCFQQNKDTYIPVFNKELYNGFGDVETHIPITGKYDVIILEGWMLGYEPVSNPTFDLILFNSELLKYQKLHQYFNCWINIKTDDINNIFHWRFNAEPKNGMNQKSFEKFMRPYYKIYRNYTYNSGNIYLINKDREII